MNFEKWININLLKGKHIRFHRFFAWRNLHIRESDLLLFLSFLIGILTALSALILKWLIHTIQHFLTTGFATGQANYLYLLYPIVGILLAGLFVKYIVKDDISHGVTKILYAISQRKSFIKVHNTFTSTIASSITIGFGGSVGAEAPIVLTGAAIGSNLGRLFNIEQRHLMLLIGCGAAGAISGIFKAPIAGLVFVIEVLMLDLTLGTVLPLLVSSVTAAVFAYITMGTAAMFTFSHDTPFSMERIPYVLLLGLLCGIISLYFTRSMNWIENIFRRLTSLHKFILGASMLSLLIFLLPPLYGEGYDTINNLLSGHADKLSIMNGSLFARFSATRWGLVVFLAAVVLLKVFASSATNGAGGTGGIFAPVLFLGCIAGFLFSDVANQLHIATDLPAQNFALMGMAGVMAGVMHAPLTGTFLIAELTGGYELFLPLMMVSAVSFAFIKLFEPHSIYAMRLAKKGELLTHQKDQALLTLLSLKEVIETDFQPLKPAMLLRDVVKMISTSSRNMFPVLNDDEKLVGIVQIDNIRNIMFRPELYDRFSVARIMTSPADVLNIKSDMRTIMKQFDATKAWNLPVVDETGRYIGFVSKSSMLNEYRKALITNFSEND